jgi:deoxyribodipyrimidine photo-lyase
MWFAGWWIHVERLPWQLGADFFFRHLLDADPASNTLSWRWVAGLQTAGKTYLPRRANIEKYVAPEILTEHTGGLGLLARPQALLPDHPMRPEISHPEIADDPVDPAAPLGIWIHDEDLRPEQGPLATLSPAKILIANHHDDRERRALPAPRQAWLRAALDDVASRAATHFRTPVQQNQKSGLPETLRQWADANNLKQVVALRPEVGPLADRLPELRQSLRATGSRLCLLSRPDDLALRPLATGGFFGFWKKTQGAAM